MSWSNEGSSGGSFVRVRTLGFAVEYAGIRVRETTTASETIALVASKLRLDSAERSRRKMVMVYRLRGERARRGLARWRVRTLRGEEALLPLRQRAAGRRSEGSSRDERREEVRFYLHDESSTPLDLCELPKDEDASGSESSEDERPPEAKFVGDRATLPSRPGATFVGTLLKRSETDPNLWRRRRCVIADDRLFYWRETVAPPLDEAAPEPAPRRDAPSSSGGLGYFSSADSAAATKQARRDGSPPPPETPLVSARDYEIDRVARSRCASIPLASNAVTEIVGRRDVPHGLEVNTASRTLLFRADTRAQQLDWLKHFNDAVEIATQNEYFALADLIITDEHSRRVGAELTRAMADLAADFRETTAALDSADDAIFYGRDLPDVRDTPLARKIAQALIDAERRHRTPPDRRDPPDHAPAPAPP